MPLTHTVRCDSCGAPLQIPSSAHFVTCQHCSAELEVQRKSEAVSTQILNQLRTELTLDRIDVQWEMRRRQILGEFVPDDLSEMPDFWKSGRWKLGLWLLAASLLFTGLIAGKLSLMVPMTIAVIILGAIFGIHCLKQSLYRQEYEIYRQRRLKAQQPRTCESKE